MTKKKEVITMEKELSELKSTLRSLVVSSPTNIDVRSMLRDYRNLVGEPLPLTKYGYRDPVEFLRERFSDCFLFSGPPRNPVLTPIVPDSLKHIDNFVRKQKVSSNRGGGKRWSVSQAKIEPENLVYKTFTESKQLETRLTPKTNNVTPPQNVKKGCDSEKETDCDHNESVFKDDDDSGLQTMSSKDNTKRAQFQELQDEICALVQDHPEGICVTDILRLYRERFKRALNFSQFGYTGIVSALSDMERVSVHRAAGGGAGRVCVAGAPAPPPANARARAAPPASPPAPDDDALPGVDYDPDVFPADCMHFLDSIPPSSLADFRPGAMIEVMVGEVYSPSHFWMIRLGDRFDIAMEEMMDEMNEYYERGEGQQRWLTRGACRVGHHCAALYERDWHRAIIVAVLDDEFVKVRHVDYGTVDRAAARALRPLPRRWAALPAQALRARLAGVRPVARALHWPAAASAAFLRLLMDRRLVANVVALDGAEECVCTLLVDTSGAADRELGRELVRAGHADAAGAPASARYLLPRFDALERGATPNFSEIQCYLRDGIRLEFVDAYRRHVLAPPDPAPAPPDPAPAPPDSAPDRHPNNSGATRINPRMSARSLLEASPQTRSTAPYQDATPHGCLSQMMPSHDITTDMPSNDGALISHNSESNLLVVSRNMASNSSMNSPGTTNIPEMPPVTENLSMSSMMLSNVPIILPNLMNMPATPHNKTNMPFSYNSTMMSQDSINLPTTMSQNSIKMPSVPLGTVNVPRMPQNSVNFSPRMRQLSNVPQYLVTMPALPHMINTPVMPQNSANIPTFQHNPTNSVPTMNNSVTSMCDMSYRPPYPLTTEEAQVVTLLRLLDPTAADCYLRSKRPTAGVQPPPGFKPL